MRTKYVAAALSALLYTQGLLGFAAIAAVLLKDRAHAADAPAVALVDPAR